MTENGNSLVAGKASRCSWERLKRAPDLELQKVEQTCSRDLNDGSDQNKTSDSLNDVWFYINMSFPFPETKKFNNWWKKVYSCSATHRICNS